MEHAPTQHREEPSKWASWEAYFFNHGANIAFLVLVVAANISMAVWGAWEFTQPHWATENALLRVTLPIARASGRLVSWNCAVLLVSGSKHFWTLIRSTPLALGFPVDNVMPYYHKIAAVTTIGMGCVVHAIPQVVNYATETLVIGENNTLFWTLGDGMATTQLAITGSALFAIFAGFFVTTLNRVRQTALGFRIFWLFHVVGISLSFPLLLVHGTVRGWPITAYMLAAPLGIYVTDNILRRVLYSTLQARVVELVALNNGGERVVKLVVQHSSFRYAPGQYAELKIPEVSGLEWHPFTIASAPSSTEGCATFYIKAVGKWTKSLYKLADVKSGGLKTIGIRGPFGAPAQNYLAYQHIVVIGSGIGVTPLLSVWKHLVSIVSSHVSNKEHTSCMEGPRPATKYPPLPRKVREQKFIESSNVNHVDVVGFGRDPLESLRAKIAYWASVLESMTVNVLVFSTLLLSEVLVFSLWLYEVDVAAAHLQSVISGFAMLLFGVKIVTSALVYQFRYLRSFAFFLECTIIGLDYGAFISSVSQAKSQSLAKAVAYFAFFGAFLVFHCIRIFHVFYTSCRPPQTQQLHVSTNEDEDDPVVRSVTGIWVSRQYSSMSFAAADLVKTIRNLSPIFSLQLYATREKQDVLDQVTPFPTSSRKTRQSD